MYQATETREETLTDAWQREFADNALAVLVDNAMAECPLTNRSVGGPEFNLRLALGAAFEMLRVETRIEWAHRLDSDVLDYESFVERETGSHQS